jgi:hypothetical protein
VSIMRSKKITEYENRYLILNACHETILSSKTTHHNHKPFIAPFLKILHFQNCPESLFLATGCSRYRYLSNQSVNTYVHIQTIPFPSLYSRAPYHMMCTFPISFPSLYSPTNVTDARGPSVNLRR